MKKPLSEFDRAVLAAALMIDANGDPVTVGEIAADLRADASRVVASVTVLRSHDILGGRSKAVIVKWGRVTVADLADTVGISVDQLNALWPLLDRMDAASSCGCENCDPDGYVSPVGHDLPG